MHCPYCQTANPAQARYCMGCGHSLVNGIVCAKCDTLLPPYARYCFHCGTVLVLPNYGCPHCGAAVQPGQAFCGSCGNSVSQPTMQAPIMPPQQYQPGQPVQPQPLHTPSATPQTMPTGQHPAQPQAATNAPVVPAALNQLPPPRSVQEMLTSLEKYLPKALYEPLERRPNEQQLIQVRDHLAALVATTKTYLPRPVYLAPQPGGQPAGGMYRGVFLFGDVSGFTPLSEQLKPLGKAGAEKITSIINSLFSELVSILFDHGGVLLKFGGDALLGLFPAETDEQMKMGALRASQAALAMQECMKQDKFAAIETPAETRALTIKCGISSGPYFAAHIGTATKMAYVTTGHTVNLAEQAEGHAHPGEVAMTQDAFDLVAEQIEAGPVNKEPDENFHRLIHVAPLEGSSERLIINEPPEGALDAQITYLVNRMDLLAPYLSGELIGKITEDPKTVSIQPDHRPVTVMFANYVGISDLIEDMGDSRPDLIIQQLNDYFVHMANIVDKYEGTLARMDQYAVGDRLVIFFGAPKAHEDDPQRAIYTALDMQDAVRKHFAALQTPSGIYRFRQRIGINSGHLFAGNAGAPNLRQEYTLMGDDINMAARLMSKASWQEIFTSDKTQKLVAPYFELADKGELKVKGKEILIPTYQVIGRRTEVSDGLGLAGPLIGRGTEMATLQSCGQGLLGGRGQIVTIIADSGLGKSRLVRELKNWLMDQTEPADIYWLEGQALSFGEQMSYWLAAQILHGALQLPPDSNDDDVLFTLWERGEEMLGKNTAREAIPFLAHLLGLELEGEWAQWVKELDPKVRQKQIFWAAREFFTALSLERPIVIVLDDAHWADEASLALFEDLLEISVQGPLMFVMAFRPRRDKGCWALRDKAARDYHHRYTEVEPAALSPEDSLEMLSALLPGAELSAAVQEEIFIKATGNPFYLEEVVRSLIEQGAVEPVPDDPDCWQMTDDIDTIRVPDTLQGAIVARIDRLTEDARQALQMAAVIGRRFQMEVMRNLSETEMEMRVWLAQLESSDMIKPAEAQTSDSALYFFPDALVQEVAYENLLVQRRQEFHRQVGETLEDILGEDAIWRECELLAYHFRNSDQPERAINYLAMAALKAQETFANETAIQNYTYLINLLEETRAGWERLFDALSERQAVHSLVGNQPARKDDLEMMLEMAEAHDDQQRYSDALNGLADLYQWSGDYIEARETAQQALDIKLELGDLAGQAEATHTLGVLGYYAGEYDTARPLLEKARDLRRMTNNPSGEAWSTMYLGMIHFVEGNYSDARQLHQTAFEIAQSRQDTFQIGIHLTNAARVSMRLGHYEDALKQFTEGLEMKRRTGDRMGQGFNLFGMGQVYTNMQAYDEAAAAFTESLEIRRAINDERGVSYCLYGLGVMYLHRGNLEQAEQYLRDAFEAHRKLGLKGESIEDLSYLSQVYLAMEKHQEAQTISEKAIELFTEQKEIPGEEQGIYLNYFKVLAARNRPEADEFLQKAYDLMCEQANRIADPDEQAMYLNHISLNQAILAEVESGQWEIETSH